MSQVNLRLSATHNLEVRDLTKTKKKSTYIPLIFRIHSHGNSLISNDSETPCFSTDKNLLNCNSTAIEIKNVRIYI